MGRGVIKGTWEEVSRHAGGLASKRVRVTILEEVGTTAPNEQVHTALAKVRARAMEMPYSGSREESLKTLRDGRAGKMFGNDITE